MWGGVGGVCGGRAPLSALSSSRLFSHTSNGVRHALPAHPRVLVGEGSPPPARRTHTKTWVAASPMSCQKTARVFFSLARHTLPSSHSPAGHRVPAVTAHEHGSGRLHVRPEDEEGLCAWERKRENLRACRGFFVPGKGARAGAPADTSTHLCCHRLASSEQACCRQEERARHAWGSGGLSRRETRQHTSEE